MHIISIILLLVICILPEAVAFNPFTVTKYAGNPVLTPSGSGDDAVAVRDACFVKTGSTYNIIYTGFNSLTPVGGWVEIMLATSTSPSGPYSRIGRIIAPAVGAGVGAVYNAADPWVMYANGKWYMFISFSPSDTSNGDRTIGYLTAAGTSDAIPTSGWTWQNTAVLAGKSTGWTSTGTGRPAGVAAPKVIPAAGGGWIMFLCNWGATTSASYQYQVGYATASSLDGPWTLNDTPLYGTPGGFQAEQIIPLQYGGRHYLICNRLALNGRGGAGWPTLGIDLLESDSQTGPYTLSQLNFIPKGTWDSQDMGVTGLIGYSADSGTIYGVYDADNVGGAAIARSIGSMTITATLSTVSIGASSMAGNFR